MGKEAPTLFKYASLGSTRTGTKVVVHEMIQNRVRKGARLGLSNGGVGEVCAASDALTQLARVSDVRVVKPAWSG
jgi:hypothetical protein